MGVKLLYVCLGNICRSAAAEGITHKIIEDKFSDKDITVDSAGTYGGHKGELPDRRMRAAGANRGYEFLSRSRKITKEDLDIFDVIVVMDDSNFEDVCSLSNESNRGKIYKMAKFCQKHKISYVPDPYYEGAEGFEYVLDILEDGCSNLLDYLHVDRFE